MKIPHVVFRVINQIVLVILRSPFHQVISTSILVIRYTGVKSGRTLIVPARYLRQGDELVSLTSRDTKWWPNFLANAAAEVLLGGRWAACQVQATIDNADLAGPLMREMWTKHPSDAAYMNVKANHGELDADDFARALDTAVVIRVTLV